MSERDGSTRKPSSDPPVCPTVRTIGRSDPPRFPSFSTYRQIAVIRVTVWGPAKRPQAPSGKGSGLPLFAEKGNSKGSLCYLGPLEGAL